jgi:hypothetical protein
MRWQSGPRWNVRRQRASRSRDNSPIADLPRGHAEQDRRLRFLDGNIDTVQQIAGGRKFLYLLSERYQFATAHRFASFA